MTKLQKLLGLAKQSFDVAKAMGTNKPEGIAIEMKSGIILTGYSQPSLAGNAARDALRSAIPNFPTESKVKQSILDGFTIAAVALVTGAENGKVSKAIMTTLETYQAVEKGAVLYVASAKTEQGSHPRVLTVMTLGD